MNRLLLLVAACGSTPDAPDAGRPDASRDSDALGIPASCAQILSIDAAAQSGIYTIDPDGNGSDPAFSVQCDMAAAGGGWTLVFVEQPSDYGATPIAYTSASPRLLGDATDAMIAYRDASAVALASTATFPIPNDWRFDTPFDYAATDLTTMVSIDGAGPQLELLRYGNESFGSLCSDAWVAVAWGRVCIAGTTAPFFSDFAAAGADDCSDSTQSFGTTLCDANRRFSIAVR